MASTDEVFEQALAQVETSGPPEVEKALQFVVHFGRHKGSTLSDIIVQPGGVKYLQWIQQWDQASDEQRMNAKCLTDEFERRKKVKEGQKAVESAPKRKKAKQ